MDEGPRFAEMISKIAHELRSPLTSVKGFSSTLLKRWDRFTDEQKLQFVETIHFDAERMGRIVSEVLDLARLESGRLQLNQTAVNLQSVVTQTAGQYVNLQGGDRVVVEIDESLTAWADAERLGHIMGNLIENGVKFSDEGPVAVTAARKDGTVELTVSDQGVGIDADLLPHVFDGPAPAGGKATPSGTGIGLYLSRRLAEAHGGTITVDSKEGQGSTFVVTMPAENPDE
jgi:signal transduction histidine kinase